MKKIITWSLIISSIAISLAYTTNSLKEQTENLYQSGLQTATNIFSWYNLKIENLDQSLKTWDYLILSQLTGINLDWVKSQIKNDYTNLIKEFTDKKYSILWELDTNENNFQNWIISTWDYDNNLENIAIEISWYQTFITSNNENFDKTLSWVVWSFNSDLKNKLNYYKTDIENYKNYKKQLEELNNNYKDFLSWYNNLENIIWLSKDVFNEKADKIKEFVNAYYSWMLDNEFNKYLQQDPNISYYKSWFKLKKEILLWFVDNKLSDSINNIINSYYPDIDVNSLKEQIDNANNKSITDIIKNYSALNAWLNSLNSTINTYKAKVQEKIQKFPSTDKDTILKTLEQDLITNLNEASKLIQDDIQQTLKWWLVFIQTREKIEQPLLEKVTDIYTKALQNPNLTGLEEAMNTLKAYEQTIILPQNIEIIKNYEKTIQSQILALKQKEITDQVNKLAITINNYPLWNNNSELEKYKQELENIYNEIKDSWNEALIKTIKNLQLEIQLKENLNKLYKVWAITYYYQYGDLTNEVADILMKYYDKYKAEWKEKLFMDKINNAFDKIKVLEESLNNDIRSYYIVMIHNWLLKFEAELENK